MRFLKLLSLLLIIVCLSCNTKKQEAKAMGFVVETKSLKTDTLILSALYYDGYIICLRMDHKLFVLDSAYQFVDSLTAKFSKLNVWQLWSFNDTIQLLTDKRTYYLDAGFSVKAYEAQPLQYGLPLYSDSTYLVDGCAEGEWGGSVFFRNKKTKQTFSYPATGVQQVLKFKDTYVVSSYLAHMDGFSDYLFIKDPTKLYELKNERQKRYCNWWAEDSLKTPKLGDTLWPSGVKYYEDTFKTWTLVVFPYNSTLYSIYSTERATVLAKHINNKLIPVQTLRNNSVNFQRATTQLLSDRAVTAYWNYRGTGNENGNSVQHQNAGMIIVQGRKITFVEFDMPHK